MLQDGTAPKQPKALADIDIEMLTAAAVAALEPDAHLQHFLNAGLRVDGRGFRSVRAMGVSHEPLAMSSLSRSGSAAVDAGAAAPPAADAAPAADGVAGSALVSLGATRVLASISLQVGVPDLAAPADGDVEVAVKFAPFSKQPAERATALSETFRDLLLRGRVVSLPDLCIEERRCAWKLCVAVLVLNDDGGVFDAGLVAAVAALSGVSLPATMLDDEGVVKLVRGQPSARLPLRTSLVPLTCGVAVQRSGGGGGGGGGSEVALLADLNSAEEGLVAAVITVVSDGDGKICGVFKPGGRAVAQTVVEECIALCVERGGSLKLAAGLGADGPTAEGTAGSDSPAKKKRRK